MVRQPKNHAREAMDTFVGTWIHDIKIGQSRNNLTEFVHKCRIIILQDEVHSGLEMLGGDVEWNNNVIEFME